MERLPNVRATAGLLICLGAWLTALMTVSGSSSTRAPTPAGGPLPAMPLAGSPASAAAAEPRRPPRQAALTPAGTPRVDFQRQVNAILNEYCLECHSQDKRKGGLSLATYADVLEGGRSGAVVRPGDSAGSLIIDRLTGAIEPQMPKDDVALDAAEINLIRLWIDEGARATPMSAPAPPPWEPPLALTRPPLPAVVWPAWQAPLDRFVASYLSDRKGAQPALVPDALFARRAYLDIWGLLPEPDELRTFVADTAPGKRGRLVLKLLDNNQRYAEHWISFWNDLLRNEDGVSYFSETSGRKSITPWLYASLERNLPYDQFVTRLLNPVESTDPEGFLTGVNWRGETSAAVKPWMQASQNTAQIFLGVNLKCNSCHDSFVSKWKLKDAYALAAYFAPEPELQLYRCDVAQDAYAEPGFLFPDVSRVPYSEDLADRRAAVAETFTDPRLGRMPRTVVNRIWTRLFGVGIVPNPDEMDAPPWSPALLDWLADDFVEHDYDLKHLLETILTSRTYQMRSVTRSAEPTARGYVFAGPEVRRLTAEQFADALGTATGEWEVDASRAPGDSAAALVASPGTTPSQPTFAGAYARNWHVASSDLTRALGRPIRDQVTSIRPMQSTTPQALELVNGATLTRRLSRGARRLLGELPPQPASLYTRAVAGRAATSSIFDIDISQSEKLWLVVQENGSNDAGMVEPAWADTELIGPDGPVPLSDLTPIDAAGLRDGAGPLRVPNSRGDGVRVRNPSVLVYDIAGRGFTRFRGVLGLENKKSDIGATLDPQLRFFVFDVEPDMERLLPPRPGAPPVPQPAVTTRRAAIDRAFWHLLGRAPSAAERRVAEATLTDPARGDRPSPTGLADLLWALTMKPEFQLIY